METPDNNDDSEARVCPDAPSAGASLEEARQEEARQRVVIAWSGQVVYMTDSELDDFERHNEWDRVWAEREIMLGTAPGVVDLTDLTAPGVVPAVLFCRCREGRNRSSSSSSNTPSAPTSMDVAPSDASNAKSSAASAGKISRF